MFSLFSSPGRSNVQHENNIAAKKVDQFKRKPLADRQNKKSVDQPQLIEKKPVNKQEEIKTEMFDFDTCSYKDVPDNYNDIILIENEFDSITSSLFAKIKLTPPPKKKELVVTEVEDYTNYDNYFSNELKDVKLFNLDELDSVPFPESNL